MNCADVCTLDDVSRTALPVLSLLRGKRGDIFVHLLDSRLLSLGGEKQGIARCVPVWLKTLALSVLLHVYTVLQMYHEKP